MNFEKMSFLKHKNKEEAENEEVSKSKEKSLHWPKYMKYAALVTLLMSSGISMAQSPEGSNNQKEKQNSELVLEKSAQEAKKLCKIMLEDPSVWSGYVGQTKSREWKSLDKKEIVQIGYKEDGKTPKWIMCEDGSKLYLDNNADGTVDRVILDGQNYDNKNDSDASKGRDELYAFESINSLKDVAEIEEGSMMSEKKSVIQIVSGEDGHPKLQIVEFDSGQHGEIDGQQAVNFVQGMQKDYLKSLESITSQMSK